MFNDFRNSRTGVVSRVLGISAFIAILFVAGCTTNGNNTPKPVSLTAAASSPGNLTHGQTGASYSITVSNAAGAVATSGAVTVTDPPTNFTVTAISGSGWTCTLATLTCTRSDVLAGGQSYPSITVTGNVTGNAGQFISIPISISGGGMTTNVTSNPSIAIVAPPTITSANSTTFTVGTSGTFTVTATGSPAPTFSEMGALPSGVSLNSTTGALSGTPAAGSGGTYPITITAQNSVTPNATQTFTLTVDQAPSITSANSASFVVGAAGTFTMSATGFPAPTLIETGTLPSGVTFNPVTGVLSGTPAVGTQNSYNVSFTAQNGIGTNVTQSFTLTVGLAPTITSANSTTFTVGSAGTFTVTAGGFPAPTFSETGTLPSGVSLSSAGVLSGTPAAGTAKAYSITITATNGVTPNASQTFTLTVDQAPAITSGTSATFTVGTAGTFTVVASGFPAPTFSETGPLPSGVTLNSTTGVLSGTPASGQQGSYPIVITAQNGIGTNATQNFTLTVNLAPAITSGNSTTFTVGVSGTFTVTATGFPAPTFAETGALPAGVTLNSTTGVLSGTPAAGTGKVYTITVTAQNAATPNATQSFTLTVDQAPAITSAGSTTFAVGSAGTFTVVGTGFPAPTFSETGPLPSGVTLNSTTGLLSGTPANTTQGSYPIVITAANGVSPNATQSFTLTVDSAPAITSGNSATFTVGTPGTFTVVATGLPAPTFIESGTLPSGVTLNSATGVLSGTPAANSGGNYPITITAQNGITPNATQTFTLTVDQAPVITSANSITFAVGSPSSFTVMASGFPVPTFSETGTLPTGVTLNSTTGVLSGTPASGTQTISPYSISFTAQNGVGTNATQSFTLTVSFTAPPSITSLNNTTFTVGSVGTFTVTASGAPAATFSETGMLPSGVTLNTTTGVLSGTPGANSGGTYPITITAQNGITPNATQSFTLTVDQAPAFTSANSATFSVGASGTFTVKASGFPAPTFGETGPLPAGVTLNATTGVLSGTPGAGTGGTYPITITAQNGITSNATQSFTLTVNTAPVITSLNHATFAVGTAGTFTVTATGIPAPTFSETGTLPSGVSLNSTTGVLSGTPSAGTGGSYLITITAQNGVTPNGTQSFTLTVDSPPVITSANSKTFTIGTAGSFTVTAMGVPVPSLTETLTLPTGVTFTDNGNGTGTLAWTAAVASGTYSLSFTASNGVGSNATQPFTLNATVATCSTNCSLSGTVSGPWVQGITLTLSVGPTAGTTTTDANGNYTFSGLAGGTYTVTPSLSGYTYSPTTLSTAVNATGQNFTATPVLASYSISGTVSYSGTYSGAGVTMIRVYPNGCTGCGAIAGTTIPSHSGAFTVRGLAPSGGGGINNNSNGNYTVVAEIDEQGTGATNASNAASSAVAAPQITNANVSVGTVTMVDRTPPTPASVLGTGGYSAPSVFPTTGAMFVSYNDLGDNFGEEVATTYTLSYGTDTNASNAGTKTIPAGSGNNVYLLSGLSTTSAYYFKISANNSSGSTTSAVTATAVTPVAPTGGFTLSGTVTTTGVTIPAGAVMYVGFFSGNNGVYFQRITSPSTSQPFTVTGVTATGVYNLFAVIDMNGNGSIDTGDITNFTGQNGPPPFQVTGTQPGIAISLTGAAAVSTVQTSTSSFNGGANSYGVSVNTNVGVKRPTAITLFSAPAAGVPFDMEFDSHGNGNFNPVINPAVSPNVGDTYKFLVSFSDGSTPQVITGTVNAVITSFARTLNMNTPVASTSNNTSAVPMLNWMAPTTSPSHTPYSYSVGVYDPNNNGSGVNWNYSGGHNSNGIPSGTTNVMFNKDGSASNLFTYTSPLQAGLAPGTTYDWYVTVQDANGNSGQYTTTYTTPGSAGPTPPTISSYFTVPNIPVNGVTTLNFNLSNPNSGSGLTNIAFSDTLTSGIQLTGTMAYNTCNGTINGVTPGSVSVSLSGASLGNGGSCTFGVNVTGTTATGGPINITTTAITSTEGGTGSTSTATLTVAGTGTAPPTITEYFSPSSISVGGTSTLNLTIYNNNGSASLSGIGFTDTLSSALQFTGSVTSNNCGGTLSGVTSGSTSMTLSGAGTLNGGGSACGISVAVTGTSSGTFSSSTSPITSNEGGTGGTSSTTLMVGSGSSSAPATCDSAPTGHESVLSGQWVAMIKGWKGTNPGSPTAAVFSFKASGTGTFSDVSGGSGITGNFDLNDGSKGASSVKSGNFLTAGSSYKVGLDTINGTGYLGCMTVASSGGTTTMRFALSVTSGSATRGRIIEWADASGNGSGSRTAGVMMPQDTTAFSGGTLANLHANYAFGEDGGNPTNAHFAIAGTFSLNTATGAVSNTFDKDDGGTVSSNQSENSTVSSPSSTTGRAVNTGSLGDHTAVYIVNANELFLIGIDPFNANPIYSGRAIVTGTSFNAASLTGNYDIQGFGSTTGNSNCNGGSICATVALGILQFSGTGTITTGQLYNFTGDGTGLQSGTPSGTYSVSSSGRVTTTGGMHPGVLYLAKPVATTEPFAAFLVGTDPPATSGQLEVGANSNVNASALAGTHIFGTIDPSDSTVRDQIGVASFASSGNITGYNYQSDTTTGLSEGDINGGGGGSSVLTITNSPLPGIGNVGSGTVSITDGTRLWFIDSGGNAASINLVLP